MDKWLIDTISEISNCSDLDEVKSTLISIRENLGFKNIVYVIKLPDSFTRSSNLVVGDYSDEWLEKYTTKDYVNIDPVLKHCFSSEQPFCWTDFSDENKEERAFFDDAAAHGLIGGISIGLPRYNGSRGMISVTTDHMVKSGTPEYTKVVLCLYALQSQLHSRICQLASEANENNTLIDFTDREQECLLWTAEGKTAQEIADILGVSESTVTFHMKNVMRKLNVCNRSQAIAKSVLEGYIVPQFYTESFPTYHF